MSAFVLVVYVGGKARYVRDVSFAERRVRVTPAREQAAQFTLAQSDYLLGRLAAERFPYEFGKLSA